MLLLVRCQSCRRIRSVNIPEPPVFKQEEASISTKLPLEKLHKMNNELVDWPKDFKVFNQTGKDLKLKGLKLLGNKEKWIGH